MTMTVDKGLIEILACPKCKGDLEYREPPNEGFACLACRLFFPVEDDIPNFIIEDAHPLEPGDGKKT
jgi:uncharacterized protein YbaR (Trm112 family)